MSAVGRKASRMQRPVSAREAVEERFDARDILRSIGPGVISGGADNDPSGIAIYSIVGATAGFAQNRSEEHTSELQSRLHLVCRLLLEKKNKNNNKSGIDRHIH